MLSYWTIVGNYRLRYQTIKLLVDHDFAYFELLKIYPTVPETQTLWGAKVIRLNHTTLLGHGLAEWFREWGQGCGAIDEIIFARGPLTRFGQDTLRHSCRRAILGSRLFAATSKGFRCLSFVKLDQAPPQSTMGNKQHTVRGPAAEGVAHNRSQDGAVSLNPSSRGRSQFWFVCYIYIYIYPLLN